MSREIGATLSQTLHLAELRVHGRVLTVLSAIWLAVYLLAGKLWQASTIDLLPLLFGEVLIVLAIFDFYYYYLYDSWVALLGLIALLAVPSSTQTMAALVACALSAGGFMCLVRLFSRGGLGLGDVKLAAVIGLYLGYSDTLLALFLAFLLGGLVASFLLLTRRAHSRTMLPFGPFLVAGALGAMLVADELWHLYEALLC